MIVVFVSSSLLLMAQGSRGAKVDAPSGGGSNNRNTSTPPPDESETASSHSNRNRRRPISPRETGTPIEGFSGVRLGMDKQTTIDKLLENPIVNLPKKYQEDDISSETAGNFVSLEANKYFKSGYFLFKDDKLYTITLRFQDNQVDFLDLLESLREKYGEGSFMDANTVAWENGRTQMILERPATIKYMLIDVAKDVRVNYTNNIVTNSVNVTEGL